MPASTAPIAWVDVETSTLSPETGDLLEIAAIVTTGPDYTPVDDGITVTIHPQRFTHLAPERAVEEMKTTMLPIVVDMHTTSGLFAEIAAGNTMSTEDADRQVHAYLASHTEPREAILGGNSITLDRNFLAAYAPATYTHLHYRSLDCSAVREFARRLSWVDPDLDGTPADRGVQHRAMDDILTSIEQARLLSRALTTAAGALGAQEQSRA